MSRHKRDFYPTPPCAALALRRWLDGGCQPQPHQSATLRAFAQQPVVDPAAGFGTLLEYLNVKRELRRAIEVTTDSTVWEHLRERVPDAVHGDALVVDWPDGNIVMNPPFDRLAPFVSRAVSRWDAHEVLVAVLHPVAWWNAADNERACIPPPTIELKLKWRPRFRHDGDGTFQDFAWSIWHPGDRPWKRKRFGWEALERPAVPTDVLEAHERLAALAGGLTPPAQQHALDLETSA